MRTSFVIVTFKIRLIERSFNNHDGSHPLQHPRLFPQAQIFNAPVIFHRGLLLWLANGNIYNLDVTRRQSTTRSQQQPQHKTYLPTIYAAYSSQPATLDDFSAEETGFCRPSGHPPLEGRPSFNRGAAKRNRRKIFRWPEFLPFISKIKGLPLSDTGIQRRGTNSKFGHRFPSDDMLLTDSLSRYPESFAQ